MANTGAKLSSFPEVNDIQTGDMFPLLSGGNTNTKIDYATLANAIIAKEVERATAAENKLESEKADKTTATSSADGLMSKSDKAKLDGIEAGGNVKSVNGKTGAVMLEKGDVGLGSVDNTKDVDKPISTAMQTALDKKADKTIATASADGLMSKTDKAKLDGIGAGSNVKSVNGKTGAVTLSKADVGLGNVDNTKDADKPISTAVQTALDAKANNSVATESTDGLMSAADKTKLDGIDPSAITTNAANIKKNADEIAKLNSAIGDGIDEATMNFTSSDVADGSATAWTSVPALASGEKHNAILGKVSQMFKNVRYLFKMLGTTDISGIGDGTATGAISALSADLAKKAEASDLAKLYPVGSIYLSTNSTNPATFIGGTWERIKDRFLLAAGDVYAAGSTGGEAQHKLTTSEMPSHTHAWKGKMTGAFSSTGTTYRFAIEGIDQWDPPMVPTGGSQPHNNMPPYLAVYMWKRVS